MKPYLLLSLILITSMTNAQDTLYLPVHGLGHEQFVLRKNGKFTFSSYLCGSTFVSFGKYKKTLFGYRFDYDTTMCPTPSLVEVKTESNSDSITLFFYNMVDSTPQPYFNALSVGEKYLLCDTEFISLSKASLKSDLLMVNGASDSLNFTFDTTAAVLHIYLAPIGLDYNCGVKNIRKLKKTKLGYLNKFVVYREDREKPWKRGRKKIVKHFYELRKGLTE